MNKITLTILLHVMFCLETFSSRAMLPTAPQKLLSNDLWIVTKSSMHQPGSQFNWRSVGDARTRLIHSGATVHRIWLRLIEALETGVLGVSFGVWHQGVGSGTFESCGLWGGTSKDLTYPTDARSDWKYGNLEARSAAWALCHVPWATKWCSLWS